MNSIGSGCTNDRRPFSNYKMNLYLTICTTCIIFSPVSTHRIHYVNRFRNFSIESETGDIYLINMTIIQDGLDHVLTGSFNITRDVRVQKINIVVNRCSFEKADCENFMEWRFPGKDLKTILHMQNQIWTPSFTNLVPRVDFPEMKKNVYQMKKCNLDAKAALTFYPEASKYYWRLQTDGFDAEKRKVCTPTLESAFSIFVARADRNKKRERANSTSKPDGIV